MCMCNSTVFLEELTFIDADFCFFQGIKSCKKKPLIFRDIFIQNSRKSEFKDFLQLNKIIFFYCMHFSDAFHSKQKHFTFKC